jgi:hypothetical protein
VIRINGLDAFERTMYADILTVALLFVIGAIAWCAGAI